jgi:hypothetical protein
MERGERPEDLNSYIHLNKEEIDRAIASKSNAD